MKPTTALPLKATMNHRWLAALLVLLASLLLATGAHAIGPNYGIRIGGHTSNLVGRDSPARSLGLGGFEAGVLLFVPMPQSFPVKVHVEAFYSGQGARLRPDAGFRGVVPNRDYRLHYANAAGMARLEIFRLIGNGRLRRHLLRQPVHPYVGLGAQVGYNLFRSFEDVETPADPEQAAALPQEPALRRTAIGMVLALGATFKIPVVTPFVEARWNRDLTTIAEEPEDRIFNNVLSINLGLRF
jgi:hypothetical protein